VSKPSIPKGTRDFLPKEVIQRKYIFTTIENVFRKYGYLPIETPTMETLDTLTGKYGDEGDKLLFKVLNNGDFLDGASTEAIAKKDYKTLTASISKRGLRYDLTVPFARFVVMYQNEIGFPFKRYQIQPVWRADRPQNGRYQEFYQCDADVVGSESLLYEGELMLIYHEVFKALGLHVNIMINNRKILFGMAEQAGIVDQFVDMTTAIDKLDKIGIDGVIKELMDKGMNEKTIECITDMLAVSTLSELKPLMQSETGKLGIKEVEECFTYLNGLDVEDLQFDITLARGLNYYTGCIFEVKIDSSKHKDVVMGSIGGGGRYANLTENFGLKGVSGVGISFGAERIYDVMAKLNLFPDGLEKGVKILFCSFDEPSLKYSFKIATQLRNAGIAVDVYPDAAKMQKQLKHADKIGVKYAAIIGENEISSNTIMCKNLMSGDQQSITVDELIKMLS
jgi:histidyl-tRNA synthetase